MFDYHSRQHILIETRSYKYSHRKSKYSISTTNHFSFSPTYIYIYRSVNIVFLAAMLDITKLVNIKKRKRFSFFLLRHVSIRLMSIFQIFLPLIYKFSLLKMKNWMIFACCLWQETHFDIPFQIVHISSDIDHFYTNSRFQFNSKLSQNAIYVAQGQQINDIIFHECQIMVYCTNRML